MHSYIVVSVVSIILFSVADSHFVRRHHMRRRNRQAFNSPPIAPNPAESIPPQAVPANTNLGSVRTEIPLTGNAGGQPDTARLPPGNAAAPPDTARLPPGSAAGLPPGNAGVPPDTARLPPGSAGVPPEGAGVPPGNAGVSPEAYQTPPRITPYPIITLYQSPSYVPQYLGYTGPLPGNVESSSVDAGLPTGNARLRRENGNPKFHSNFSPNNARKKRRRKNVLAKNHKRRELTEKKRPLLEESSRKNALNKNDYLKRMKNYLGEGIKGDTTTLIPIPKGLQMKTASKQNNGQINAVVNITSSTEQTSFGNSTEIEKVVEMQMEKKIEDEKGANKGFEEVRIVEREHIKPVVSKKSNGLNLLKRRRKSHNKRFIAHHRGKRSTIESTERPRVNSVFNKMARRFFTAVRRKERVVEDNKFSTRRMIPNSKKNATRYISNPLKNARELVYDRDEMNDFVRFFLKQMQKFRRSRESTNLLKELNVGKWLKIAKLAAHNIKKINENFEYPIHMNAFLNLNMTWDIKLKEHSKKYRNILDNHSSSITALDATPTAPIMSTTQEEERKVVYISEKNDSRLLNTVLIFSIAMSLFALLAYIMREKLYMLMHMDHMTAKTKGYQICHGGQSEKLKMLKYSKINNVCTEDYPQLEWQSENGDWLSDKETDFK